MAIVTARPEISDKIVARFEFIPEKAKDFAWGGDQTVVEMTYDNILELIHEVKTKEDAIKECTAIVDGQVIDLRELSS